MSVNLFCPLTRLPCEAAGGVIIPLSSAIRGSQHSYIEDPNYFRTQNVPGLHTLMNARKTYHIYIHNYPNFACTKTRPAYIHNYPISACTKITPGLHTQLPQFCMYEKHARPTEKKNGRQTKNRTRVVVAWSPGGRPPAPCRPRGST